MKQWRLWGALLALWMLSACLPAPTAPPPPTSPAAPTAPSPTATPVWFPPTATPTPLPPTPILTPTPDMLAGASAPLVIAPFTDPAAWYAPQPYNGHFGVADGVLSLTGLRPRGDMVVLRHTPQAADLYLSVEATPQACQGDDAYGIVVRATASANTYYRFGVTCAGMAFIEAVSGGVPVPQEAPLPLGIPTGAPVHLQMSVRAAGKWLHFALNGRPLFTVRDDRQPYGRGYFGLFVRSASDEGALVAFRGLDLRRVLPPPDAGP